MGNLSRMWWLRSINVSKNIQEWPKIRQPNRTAHLELRTCAKLISRCKLYGTVPILHTIPARYVKYPEAWYIRGRRVTTYDYVLNTWADARLSE